MMRMMMMMISRFLIKFIFIKVIVVFLHEAFMKFIISLAHHLLIAVR